MAYRRRSGLAVLIVLGLCLVARSAAAQRSSAPQATTGVATNVTATSATLTGTVSTNGPATTAYFQWGTTTAYGQTTASQSIGIGTRTVIMSALTGLTPSRTYHYRVVASNGAGTSLGADMMFTTAAFVPPTATTGAATNMTTTSATLTGTVNANGLATMAYFQWGTTTAYDQTTASQSIGSGTGTVSVSATLTGLTPSRTYHYRVVASNDAGTTFGTDMLLRTFAAAGLTQISEDVYTNTTSQHATQVEPHVFAHGDTLVAAFQSGRFFNGGASDISFATSQDGGATWVTGDLPGITTIDGSGPYGRVSDPAVAFDARHNVWL